jgi:hypothetical protein
MTLIERQKLLAQYLLDGAPHLDLLALSLHGAAAAVGNATAENLCKPVTPGRKDHGSDGLFQWRLDRLAHLKQLALKWKMPWNHIETQAWFFLWELKNSYHGLYSDLVDDDKSIPTLTADIEKYFERPASLHDVPRRIKYAEDAWKFIKDMK